MTAVDKTLPCPTCTITIRGTNGLGETFEEVTSVGYVPIGCDCLHIGTGPCMKLCPDCGGPTWETIK